MKEFIRDAIKSLKDFFCETYRLPPFILAILFLVGLIFVDNLIIRIIFAFNVLFDLIACISMAVWAGEIAQLKKEIEKLRKRDLYTN